MKQSFCLTGEDGQNYQITFTVIHTEDECRCYGIRACMETGGEVIRQEEETARFITLAEAEAVVKMLCRYQVMPCSLHDVL